MNFKAYDILSSLVPGFILLVAAIKIAGIPFDKDWIIPYTAIAFLFGYVANTLSSWLEDVYFFSWGGKPSNKLLDGHDVWKVRFYHTNEVKGLLQIDIADTSATNDKLFSFAMIKANGEKDTRIDDFNAAYAFSRVLLTTVLLTAIGLLIKHYCDWRYYTGLIPITIIIWLRCKQRGYYYSREVLNVYLKLKKK